MNLCARRVQMAGQLTGKKVAIIVANEFEDIELLYPVLRLSEEGAEIVVAPVHMGLHPRPYVEGKPVTGRFGHPVPIPVMAEDKRYRLSSVEELSAAEIDCLLFPGGFSPDALRRHAGTLELVRACHQQGIVLAAICHGPWVLISAGVMQGRRATGFAAVRDDLVNAGAEFVDVPAVRDGNIITARVPDDLPEFCQEIIKALSA
jgi:protease I